MTFVLALTGSIGMGKSATAAIFRALGVPVHDSDATVHALYRDAAAPLIAKEFPGTVTGGVVDRAALGKQVLGVPERLKALEAIVHPLVRAARDRFLAAALAARAPVAVLDIPLLFETGAERECDAVLVVTADPATQRSRVLARPGMTPEKFEAIRAKQMPDADKREKAHFLVDTGRGFPAAERQVRGILAALAGRPGRVLVGRTRG
ncbi:MAG TPA: dephospho-CoA kinase [Beijerinckiaceae bacterium]|jgi:dephospho-CoA kinase